MAHLPMPWTRTEDSMLVLGPMIGNHHSLYIRVMLCIVYDIPRGQIWCPSWPSCPWCEKIPYLKKWTGKNPRKSIMSRYSEISLVHPVSNRCPSLVQPLVQWSWVVDSQFARIRKLIGFARIRPGYARLLDIVRIALPLTPSPAGRIRNSHWFANWTDSRESVNPAKNWHQDFLDSNPPPLNPNTGDPCVFGFGLMKLT